MRASSAAKAVPSENAGRTSERSPSSAPAGGNQCRPSEKSSTRTGARKNRGIATPSNANSSAAAATSDAREPEDADCERRERARDDDEAATAPRPMPSTAATAN